MTWPTCRGGEDRAGTRETLTSVLGKTLEALEGKIGKNVKAISLIKANSPQSWTGRMANLQGVDVKGADIHIFADVIENRLGVSCSALSGANIADEVASDHFSETTIGYRTEEDGKMWQKLFGELFAMCRCLADDSHFELPGEPGRRCELTRSIFNSLS